MGRIEDFDFHHDVRLSKFKDEVRRIINFGKYADPIVTSLPDWAAQPGEGVLYRPSSGGTTRYFYAGSAWISSWSVTA